MFKRNMVGLSSVLFALSVFTLVLCSCSSDRDNAGGSVSRAEIQGVIEFLSSDLLEGRAPGTRGGELAEEYVRSVFKLLGFEQYEGSYFQEFTLKGYATSNLSVEASGIRLEWKDDIVGSYVRDVTAFALSGGAVFAGYGIVSDAWSWDDYKDVPVEGKIVIVRVNEPGRDAPPPAPADSRAPTAGADSILFEGGALTYYGRWTYKIEEAARRGARGILLVHTTETAGYGWHVVRNSWGGEELYLPSSLENDLAFRGWIREECLREIMAKAGTDLGDLYARSETREFMPVDLGFRVMIEGRNASRELTARNVVGVIPGGDPKLKDRSIVLSAHIDHLGRDASLEGDQIYNGAIDNAVPVAAMIMTAKILAARRGDMKYSVIVLACQAEEAGLLGSRYFAERLDPESVVCNINYESTPVWERSRDIMAVGAKYSSLDDIMQKIAGARGLGYSYFSLYDQGFFYRADQFSFARRGIPAIWISAGEEFEGGVNHIRDFFKGGAYHTVDDEFDTAWPLESTKQTIQAAVDLVLYLNRHTPELRWKGKMTFPVEE
jgi:hypothetical protein